MNKIKNFFAVGVLLCLFVVPFSAQAASPAKTALIVVNWNAPSFGNEATAVASQLKRLGWSVYLFENTESDGATIKFNVNGKAQSYTCGAVCGWQAIFTALVPPASAKAGDQILLDIQGDGTSVFAQNLTLADGQVLGLNGSQTDIDSVLSYEEFAKTFHYPGNSPLMWQTHSIEAFTKDAFKTAFASDSLTRQYGLYFNNMIASADARDLSSMYAGHGAKVTVIDHSCQGGATAKLLETLKNPNVCGIATTGIDSPGIQGEPPLSQFLSKAKAGVSMENFREYVSNYLYSGPHKNASRIHQAGYSVSCTGSMAVREMVDDAASAYGTWWDWNRSRPSHVTREPGRYTSLSDVSLDTPWMPSEASQSHIKDCRTSGKNCDLSRNPRFRIAEGWVRWFEEELQAFEKNPSTGAGLPANIRAQAIAHLENDSQTLVSVISTYADALFMLDSSLSSPVNHVSYYGSPAVSPDDYLRTVFIQHCLCADPTAVKQLQLVCPAAHARFPLPAGYNDAKVCSDASAFVKTVLMNIPAKQTPQGQVDSPFKAWALLQAFDHGTGPGGSGVVGLSLTNVGADLQVFELACHSQACSAQKIF